MAEEGLKKTDNELIHIGCPIPFETETFLGQLAELMNTAYANREDIIREMVEKIVSTYHPEKASDSGKKDAMYQKLVKTAEQTVGSA